MATLISKPSTMVVLGSMIDSNPTPGTDAWVPDRDAGGVVRAGSFASLPLNRWVQVSGTQLQGLASLLLAAGWDPAVKEWSGAKMLGIVRGYGGCAKVGTSILYPWIGGHGDGSFNGIPRFNAAKMAWEIEAMPSDPNANGREWTATYAVPGGRGLAGYTGTYTYYPGATSFDDAFDRATYRDVLPDGHPTARHSYYTAFYDSRRNEVGTGALASQWVYNRGTGQFTRRRWKQAGADKYVGIWGHLHYHAGKDALFGHLSVGGDLDMYSWFKIPAGTGTLNSANPGAYFSGRGAWSLRLDEDRILWTCWNDDVATPAEYWGIYNMATESGIGGPVGNGYARWNEMPVAALVPSWGTQGQVIRRNNSSGAWWAFDIGSKSNVPYTPEGNFPAVSDNGPAGNKWVCMPELNLVVALGYVSNYATPAIHVLRFA